jgi:hypothetical protein
MARRGCIWGFKVVPGSRGCADKSPADMAVGSKYRWAEVGLVGIIVGERARRECSETCYGDESFGLCQESVVLSTVLLGKKRKYGPGRHFIFHHTKCF